MADDVRPTRNLPAALLARRATDGPVQGTPPPGPVGPAGPARGAATVKSATNKRSARVASASASAGRSSTMAVVNGVTALPGGPRTQERVRVVATLPAPLVERAEAASHAADRPLSTWIRLEMATGLADLDALGVAAGRAPRTRSRGTGPLVDVQLYLDGAERKLVADAVAATGATRSALIRRVIERALER